MAISVPLPLRLRGAVEAQWHGFPVDKTIYGCTVYSCDARPSPASPNLWSTERGNDPDSGKSRGCGPTGPLPPDHRSPSTEGVLHQPTPQSYWLSRETSLHNSFFCKHFKSANRRNQNGGSEVRCKTPCQQTVILDANPYGTTTTAFNPVVMRSQFATTSGRRRGASSQCVPTRSVGTRNGFCPIPNP